MAHCERRLPSRVCGAPATAKISVGCVHEHTGGGLTCARCLAELKASAAAGDFICTPCEVSTAPHRCPVFIARQEITR